MFLDSSSITTDFYVDDGKNDDYPDQDNIKKSSEDIPINENDDFISEKIISDTNINKFYNKNRPSLEYLEKQQRKQKLFKVDDDGSGNFSNIDDDDDDENDNNKDNDNNNNDQDDEFFISQQRKTNYFRKNTNDAIKIISTPHGKVGIVYDQTPIIINNNNSTSETTKFNEQQQQKITPVLTPDGKVALLYRGASENTKYEPILNLTLLDQQFNTKQQIINNDDNKTSATFDNNNNAKNNYDMKMDYDTTTEDLGYDDDDDEIIVNKDIIITNPSLEIPSREMEKATIIQTTHLKPHLEIEYENSILPNINRPLSEVLGIKKNQFKQFRIKDVPTTTTTTTWLPPFFNRDDDNDDDIILGDRNRNYGGGSSLSINYNNNNNNKNWKILTDMTANEYDDKNFDRNRPSDDAPNNDDGDENTNNNNNDFLSKSEVVNLAIIPHFDEEFELIQQQQRYREQYAAAGGSNGLHYHHRYRYRHFNQDLTSVHCIMQALMGLAAISTVFGMLGAFFKQRIIDQFRTMHW